MRSLALDILRCVGSVALVVPPSSAIVYGVLLVHVGVTVPLASLLAVRSPEVGKPIAWAETTHWAEIVAVQLNPVAVVELPLVGHVLPLRFRYLSPICGVPVQV